MAEETTPVAEPSQETAPEVKTEETAPETQEAAKEATPGTEATPPPETTAESAEAPPERVVPAADGYVLPEGIPAEMAEFASENDMTQAQLDASLVKFGKFIEANAEAEMTKLREMGDAHLQSWGDQAKPNVELAKRALSYYDPDGNLAKLLNETGAGNHPVVLDHLLKLGQGLQEGGFLRGTVNRPVGKKTAAQGLFGGNHPSAEKTN